MHNREEELREAANSVVSAMRPPDVVEEPQKTEFTPPVVTRDQDIKKLFRPFTINGRGGHTGSPRNSWT